MLVVSKVGVGLVFFFLHCLHGVPGMSCLTRKESRQHAPTCDTRVYTYVSSYYYIRVLEYTCVHVCRYRYVHTRVCTRVLGQVYTCVLYRVLPVGVVRCWQRQSHVRSHARAASGTSVHPTKMLNGQASSFATLPACFFVLGFGCIFYNRVLQGTGIHVYVIPAS